MSILEFLDRLETDPFDPALDALLPKEKSLAEFGFSDFRREITQAARANAQHFYFTQSRGAYYADYRPVYPDHSAADFTVGLCFESAVPRLTMYQETACLPTIKQYHTMSGLLYDIQRMEVQNELS